MNPQCHHVRGWLSEERGDQAVRIIFGKLGLLSTSFITQAGAERS